MAAIWAGVGCCAGGPGGADMLWNYEDDSTESKPGGVFWSEW